MKKPTTTIASNTHKLKLARQTLRHLTAPELARARGGDDDDLQQPTYGHLTQSCVTCTSG